LPPIDVSMHSFTDGLAFGSSPLRQRDCFRFFTGFQSLETLSYRSSMVPGTVLGVVHGSSK
jgi:hypothetical protein